MKRVASLTLLIVLLSVSTVIAKVIFVGSHGGVEAYTSYWDLGETFDPLAKHQITKNSTIDDVRLVAEATDGVNNVIGGGVDASIAFFRINCDAMIFPLISKNTASVLIGKNYVQQNYEEGDYVFLVGYSAGGKYVINLSDELEEEGIPVHFLGMIDPVVGLNISIPKNVEFVETYLQRSEVFDFQGLPFFFYNGSETEYHSYIVTSTADGPEVNHYSIDNLEIVWSNLGGRMLSIIEISTGFEQGPLPDENAVVIEEEPNLTSFDQNDDFGEEKPTILPDELNDPDDPEPTDPDSDPDLHISRFHIREVGEDDYEHNVERTLYWGESIRVEGELKVRNESSQMAKDVDSDYRIENNRDFDDDDTKVDEDNPFDINPGEKVTKKMNPVTITVAVDGQTVKVFGDRSRNFDVKDGFVKIYFFADVEEDGGDHDISSESDEDEYAKVEITVRKISTQAEIKAALSVINMMLMD